MGESIGYITIYIVVGIIGIILWAQILRKSGNNPWYSLVMIIPLINLAAFIFFATLEWPISKANRELRRRIKTLREQEHTMVCDECGNPIAEQDRFCSTCGSEFEAQPNICPNCKKETASDGKFCSHCGTPL